MSREKCSTRLSIALTGQSASSELLGAENPQTQIPMLLQSTAFIERLSRFINSEFNRMPGATSEEDSSYHLAKHVLTQRLPWKDMFVGQFRVERDTSGNGRVVQDADGLGYFRSPAWLRRYAGNEEQGYKLSTAYRIMHNTIGLKLVPSVNAPDADISTQGRSQNAVCRSCHFEGEFALDKVARVLTRRQGTGDQMTFVPSTEAPQTILGGQVINDDRELVQALIQSVDFRFNSCQLVFKFLYGRSEYTCDGSVFDRCMDAFMADGTLQSAIAAVAGDATYCQ